MSYEYIHMTFIFEKQCKKKKRDKMKKKEIKRKNERKLTEIRDRISLQKNKYYNMITINNRKNIQRREC